MACSECIFYHWFCFVFVDFFCAKSGKQNAQNYTHLDSRAPDLNRVNGPPGRTRGRWELVRCKMRAYRRAPFVACGFCSPTHRYTSKKRMGIGGTSVDEHPRHRHMAAPSVKSRMARSLQPPSVSLNNLDRFRNTCHQLLEALWGLASKSGGAALCPKSSGY